MADVRNIPLLYVCKLKAQTMWKIVSLTGGFVILILGAGYLVDNASSLASKLGIPNLVIGLTIVAFGTSAPELVVSIISS